MSWSQTPTRYSGYAKSRSEAAYQNLWPWMAYTPCLHALGGANLSPITRRDPLGTLTNMLPATDWGRYYGLPSLNFDGVDAYVSMTTSGPTTNICTIVAWVNLRVGANYDSILYRRSPDALGLHLSGATNFPLAYTWTITGNDYSAASGLFLTVGQWHRVALTVTPTAGILYLDRRSFTNTETHGTKSLGSSPWRIGSDPNFGRYWDGQIADVRIYLSSMPHSLHMTDFALGPGGWAIPRRRLGRVPAAPPAGQNNAAWWIAYQTGL